MLQGCTTIVKNSIEIQRNEQFLNQCSSRHCIDHVIGRHGSAFVLGKGVLMNPQSVGASGLLVNEACGRLANDDLALPTNRQASNAEPIVDPCSAMDGEFTWAEDFKVEPWRSNSLKILRIGKESKNPLPRLRYPKAGL